MKNNFTYNWKLEDLKTVEKNGRKVFSFFCCGGGSTMGYKMAGYDVLGGVEIDERMAQIYKKNHNPKIFFCEDIRKFNKRKDIPEELMNLDILDGSPPCSVFSMSGKREKDWGKEREFMEGQESQTLDDLFFHFIETVRILNPKIFIAENVTGLLMGQAKGYTKKICDLSRLAGYEIQIFLLDASKMGLPQKRERVFFIGRRKDLNLPKIKFKFNEKLVSVGEAFSGLDVDKYKEDLKPTPHMEKFYKRCLEGELFRVKHKKRHLFNHCKLKRNKPSQTITTKKGGFYHFKEARKLSIEEFRVLQSFPEDFNFIDKKMIHYTLGMSVPPLVMYKISREIYSQIFEGLKNESRI